MIQQFSQLLQSVRECRLCEKSLPLGPRPVLQIDPRATILIAGQAPGRRVHESGIPFDGTDKLTNSATGTWECHASFGLNTRSEWALVSTFRALQSPSSSASPRLRVNLSVPS